MRKEGVVLVNKRNWSQLEPTVIDESSTVMLTNDDFEKESNEVNKQKGVREESEEEDEEESGHFALMKPRT